MIKPHLHYLKYVLVHKWHVFWACLALRVPLHQALLHDWQKFLPVEWFPYVNHFYGSAPIQRDASGYYDASAVGGAFDYAWLHHQHYGPHHWQHWVLRQDDGTVRALPMPERYVREMVADWIGAGKAQGNPATVLWYDANRERIIVHPETRSLIGLTLQEALFERLIDS